LGLEVGLEFTLVKSDFLYFRLKTKVLIYFSRFKSVSPLE